MSQVGYRMKSRSGGVGEGGPDEEMCKLIVVVGKERGSSEPPPPRMLKCTGMYCAEWARDTGAAFSPARKKTREEMCSLMHLFIDRLHVHVHLAVCIKVLLCTRFCLMSRQGQSCPLPSAPI